MLLSQLKARTIAGGEQLRLAVIAAVPDGADGVDDVFAGKRIRAGELCLTGLAAAEPQALREQPRPRRTVDAAVHPAAARQRRLRRIDNGIHRHFRYIVADKKQGHSITAEP